MKKLLINLAIIIAITFLFALPDVIFKFINPLSPKFFSAELLAVFGAIAFLLSASKNHYVTVLITLFLGILQLTATLYLGYFGCDIMPEIVEKFWAHPLEDSWEISLALLNAPVSLYILLFTVLSSYGLILFLVINPPSGLIKIPFASLLLILLIAFPIIRVNFHPRIYLSYPNHVKPSLYNALNSCSILVNKYYKPGVHTYNFAKYTFRRSNPGASNIIVIMGESTRADYMSIFGYDKDTTPLLQKYVGNQNFISRNAVAAGVSTNVVMPVFFNLMREPGNLNVVVDKTVNLFRMAKLQGYKTTLISMQSASLLYAVGVEFIDHFVSRETMDNHQFTLKRDELLFDHLGDLALLPEKNFIVLHMRSMHSPFKDNYSHHKELAIYSELELQSAIDREQYEHMAYANAMRFNDLIIDSTIKYLVNNLAADKEGYVFYTSDHGELLGENGLYGHNHLNLECAKVPFLIFGVNTDQLFLNQIRTKQLFSHYDIGLLILNRMGIEVINPNLKNLQAHYIHGTNILSPYPYLEYIIDDISPEVKDLKKGDSLSYEP